MRDNLLYGDKRTPPAEWRLHVDEVAALLGIDALQARAIDQRSGGQRQRVSPGRALLTSPRVPLLDEPLSALDPQTKREIMPFLSRLASETGEPIIMISHALDDRVTVVCRLGDGQPCWRRSRPGRRRRLR